MQKKVIALAVAGALAAPAAVMAQSTVNVFGKFYGEYSFVEQDPNAAGNNLANPDYLQTPGSEIGFKGEEKLGGGMSAWFQCTSTADFRGVSQSGFCARNSAIGFKGGFGNAFIGVWDTPFKRSRVGNVGGRDTGVFGTAFLMYGSSTTVTDGASAGVFSRRQRNSINYDTPSFGGFKGMVAMSTTNSGTNDLSSAPNAKPRSWSLAGTYMAGPLAIGAGYDQHDKFYAAGGDEEGYHISASYKFGPVKVGGAFTSQEWDSAPGANGDVDAWHVGVEWQVAGPHNLAFGYTQADDIGGNSAAIATRPASGANTGAKLYQIRYQYKLSKRTWVGGGYSDLSNDTGAGYTLGGFGGLGTGADMSAFALQVEHRF